ncbi:hypothetical protein RDWZM_004750 [Blomia tropicalis]|uniref:Uncharacterized protein n=1 Tax=Blomia tropicalis TaxID=40697 RepID=A0A9Q0M5E1_BLOTA|nr:hypothetical protein RDWZM_004750 [Blomia tropicalis]
MENLSKLLFITFSLVLVYIINVSNENRNSLQSSNDADDTCHRIENASSTQHYTIRCIGKLRSSVILITKDYLVYELPLESVTKTINKLYIGENKPIPIDEKWPNLVRDKYFIDAKKHFYNAFTVVDSKSEYLLFNTKWKTCDCTGSMYDITNDYATDGFSYLLDDDQILLSTEKLSTFFGLNKDKDGGLHIAQYYFGNDSIEEGKIFRAIRDNKTLYYRICEMDAKQIMVVRDKQASCKPIKWPIMNGFVTNGQIYLFGTNYIITFAQTVYNETQEPTPYERIPFNTFIECGGNVVPIYGRNKVSKPPVKMFVLISILLTTLLACLCCMLMLVRRAVAKHQKKNNNKNTSFNRDESGLLSFGILSKKASSKLKNNSARSSNVTSLVQPLSKKGSGTNKSARSKGSSKHGISSRKASKNINSARSNLSKCDNSMLTKPCRKMKNANGAEIEIRCIGKLSRNVILVTRDYLVYDLPLSSVDSTINKLYIGNNTPIPIGKKWPNLVTDRYFQTAEANFYNAFVAMDSESEYILFTTKWNRCRCIGSTYDMINKRPYQGVTYLDNDDQVLLSSNDLSYFYALNKYGNRGLQIARFHFIKDRVPHSAIRNVDPNRRFKRLCEVEGNQLKIVSPDSHQCERPINWPILNGFVSDGKFYLFGSNYIITFPQKAYDTPNQGVKFYKIPFNQFIQCGANITVQVPRHLKVKKSHQLLDS